jgi:hypothetical protein
VSDGEQVARGKSRNGTVARQWWGGVVGARVDTEELQGGAVLEGGSTGLGEEAGAREVLATDEELHVGIGLIDDFLRRKLLEYLDGSVMERWCTWAVSAA